jgi:hypothetical protein
MALRTSGILLFLPVPIVLFLFTRVPMGVPASLALGVVVMVTHRLYARAFARRHAEARCLWCGGPSRGGTALRIDEPLGRTEWRACSSAHVESVRRLLGWAQAHQTLLKVGILGGLAVFLVGALASHFQALGPTRPDDWVAFFRFAVAVAVLPMGWMAPRARASAADPLPVPFPVHIQALVGSVVVVWLFRIMGIVWLGLALVHVATRAGLAA